AFRGMPDLATLTIRDLYECLTAAALATRLRGRVAAPVDVSAERKAIVQRSPHQAPRRQYLAVAAAQTGVILTLLVGGGFVVYGMLYCLYFAYAYLSAVTPYWYLV